jgi:dihydrofolate reductase
MTPRTRPGSPAHWSGPACTSWAGSPTREWHSTSRRKPVFSSTLQAAGWAGTTIVSGDLAAGLDALRQHGSGEILAHGGIRFAQSLARLDLVDEYRLGVVPGTAGGGPALFADLPRPRPLELVSSTAFANGIVGLTYRRPR